MRNYRYLKQGMLLFLPCFLWSILPSIAQTFEGPLSGISISGIGGGTLDVADVNGDGAPDVLITGSNGSNPIAELYLNDGDGGFNLVSTPFTAVTRSAAAIADVNQDQAPDIIIAGEDAGLNRITELYLNDGSGGFALATTPFKGFYDGDIAIADANGDQIPDVLIGGTTNIGPMPITELYINDGTGSFTLDTNTPFTPLRLGKLALVDLDGDRDQDVFIIGSVNVAPGRIAEVYLNDGAGGFSLLSNAITSLERGLIAFADVDDNQTLDLLITGLNVMGSPQTELYLNDGTGIFTLDASTPFKEMFAGGGAFSDVDLDGDQDVLFVGTIIGTTIAELYLNDGEGGFTLETSTPFNSAGAANIGFFDKDGDGDEDVLITGATTSGNIAELFENTTPIPEVPLGNTKMLLGLMLLILFAGVWSILIKS